MPAAGVRAGKNQKKLAAIFYAAGPAKLKALLADHLQQLHARGLLHIEDAQTAAYILSPCSRGRMCICD